MSSSERRIVTLRSGPDAFVALRRRWCDDPRLSIVLVPGWREPRPGHLRLYARLADALRDIGLPVETWQFDLAGQGDSTLPDEEHRWPGQLRAVVDACAAPVYAVGRGAAAVLAVAQRHSICRLVAVEPPQPDAETGVRLRQTGCEEAVLADISAARERANQLWAAAGPECYDLIVSDGNAIRAITADLITHCAQGETC